METSEQTVAPPTSANRQATVRSLVAGAVITALMVGVLASMGRVIWCSCGSPVPWSGDIWSMHNSQHLADPYVFTHMLHGVVFFGLTRLALGADRLFPRFTLAMVVEAAWEISENTPMVIERYRETTISLDYYGDSIVNSMGDLWACALGFWIAKRLPWWGSVGVFVGTELVLLATIRDSLLVNVIMLIHPVQAILDWQSALAPG